uniref:NinG protein n=1 Tax=Siphoviridae sp. ctfWC31 TaxID=2826414 RepID=A0A8S5N645_9CAUD|nr:MAG TPA: NinG protein [Siphoviridae sp. ctfWC31]
MAILIEDLECYKYAKNKGYEPLTDKRFYMPIRVRVDVQRYLFGTGHTPAENERFYRYCWDLYPHICEECMRPLTQFSATYISHIRTRGAFPEAAHDVRNVNILCFKHHNQWETGNRKAMRIYPGNVQTIEQLTKEYNEVWKDKTIL